MSTSKWSENYLIFSHVIISGLAIYLIYGMSHSKEEDGWSAKRLESENTLESIRTWSAASNDVNTKDEGNHSQSQF